MLICKDMIPFNNSQDGKRVVLFSYGSGLTATMFSLKLSEGRHPFSLSNILSVMNVAGKLKSRHEVILHFLQVCFVRYYVFFYIILTRLSGISHCIQSAYTDSCLEHFLLLVFF